MAGAQSFRTRGSQFMQKDSHSRARAAPEPQRESLLPRVQMHVWCFAARLCAAPAHRGSPGTDAGDVRAPQLDCGQVWHVRPAALHALFPSHSRRDALRVAPHAARLAWNRLSSPANLGRPASAECLENGDLTLNDRRVGTPDRKALRRHPVPSASAHFRRRCGDPRAMGRSRPRRARPPIGLRVKLRSRQTPNEDVAAAIDSASVWEHLKRLGVPYSVRRAAEPEI
jgi:hypothetical protein